MKYRRTTTEMIEVVCVYDPEKGKKQHPYIYGYRERYLAGQSDGVPLQKGDWIVLTKSLWSKAAYYIIPVAEQDAWEEMEE